MRNYLIKLMTAALLVSCLADAGGVRTEAAGSMRTGAGSGADTVTGSMRMEADSGTEAGSGPDIVSESMRTETDSGTDAAVGNMRTGAGDGTDPVTAGYAWEEDERLESEWHIDFTGAMEAWERLEAAGMKPGGGVVVAVVDTGINTKLKEFAGNLWVNEAEAGGLPEVDDDGNGYVDDIYGPNLVNAKKGMLDTNGHGTEMSGIIAMAAGNGGGAGMAYGAKIMPVKVSEGSSFSIEDTIEGIRYAADNGADIISLSCGTYEEDEAFEEAVREASEDCILVAAAGNEETESGEAAVYPAAYQDVIGVTSCGETGELSVFTNWDGGASKVYDIAAPGERILTVTRRGAYRASSGTSQAAAVVSGALAILRGMYPDRQKYPARLLKEAFLSAMKQESRTDSLHGTCTYPLLQVTDFMDGISAEGQEIPGVTASSLPAASGESPDMEEGTDLPGRAASGDRIAALPEESPEGSENASSSGISTDTGTGQENLTGNGQTGSGSGVISLIQDVTGQMAENDPDTSSQMAGSDEKSPVQTAASDTDRKQKSSRTIGQVTYRLSADGSSACVVSVSKSIQEAKIKRQITIAGKKVLVSVIRKDAFRQCTQLKRVTLPASVKRIGAHAFQGCVNLRSITFPKSVKRIGNKAFYGDKRLARVVFRSEHIPGIGRKAFSGISPKATFQYGKTEKH